MASLARLPELVGFFSYSREDDEAFRGSLSALRDTIQRELGAQLGRTKRNFRLWQDQEAIAPGKDWEAEITRAVEQSVFFIPIVTPRAVNSDYCKFEFSSFVARARARRSYLPDSLHLGPGTAGRGGVAQRSGAVGRRQAPICRLAPFPAQRCQFDRFRASDRAFL
jgi:hypothetical protein